VPPAKKKRRSQPTRLIPPNYPTGAAESAATAADRYYVDSDSAETVDLGDGRPILLRPFFGIRDRETKQFDPRPGMTASQVHDEVARLNAGLPVSAVSQGIGRSSPTVVRGSAAWWAELLARTEPTRGVLQDAINTERKLSTDDVRELMTYHDDTGVDFRVSFPYLPTQQLALPPRPVLGAITVISRRHAQMDEHKAECQRLQQAAEKAERILIASVLKQLKRTFGIKTADGRNDHRAAKKRPL
jgi:hypothetical protein